MSGSFMSETLAATLKCGNQKTDKFIHARQAAAWRSRVGSATSFLSFPSKNPVLDFAGEAFHFLAMALTPSNMLPLGTKMPVFELPDTVTGRVVSSTELAGKPGILAMFICAHCPYVIHLQKALADLGRDFSNLGIVAISANDATSYPDDAPGQLKAMALNLGFQFPFCYDESQSVARAFTAACTPDFFLFDSNQELVYRGQFDESRPGKGTPTGHDLRAAIENLLAGVPINPDQKPSVGCNIKWKVAAASRR
jgi:peroxiredoxin